ncbi:MAG: family 10 glycosylhydrolase [Candidatus Latescibacterota bacterium]
MAPFLAVALALLSVASAAPARGGGILLYGDAYLAAVAQSLDQLGVPYEAQPEGPLAPRHPAEVEVIFLAHGAGADTASVAWLAAFLDAGGRLCTFYTLPPALQEHLGLRLGQYVRPEGGPLSDFRSTGAVAGLPAVVRQRSHNFIVAQPVADSVVVAARWHDSDGKDTGRAALLVGPRHAHLTHVLLGEDLENSARLCAALLDHFVPARWSLAGAARGVLAGAQEVGGGPDSLAARTRRSAQARQTLARAEAEAGRAQALMDQGQGAQALSAAFAARRLRVRAYAQAQVSRQGEFRGVWLHSPYGVDDWGWERTCRVLAEAGFNAIVPNMLDAGRTSYPSAVLPADARVALRGDQLAQAVAAAHRHGLELHAWKVNYNLYSADSSFVGKLRREGRLQVDADGHEVAWLCPSHPDNLALEAASMLEVVRRYPVDGLHFDYIRYNDSRGCYDQGCRQRFEAETGHRVSAWPEEVLTGELAEAYQQWRRDQVTRLVRTVSLQARRIRPDIRISAAVFPDWPQSRVSIGQDCMDWVTAGYLDFVCPMDYIPEMEPFRRTVEQQVDWVGGRVPLYVGIGAFRLAAADQLVRQLEWTRQAGADGFILFQYDPGGGGGGGARRGRGGAAGFPHVPSAPRPAAAPLPLLALGFTAQRTQTPDRSPHVDLLVDGPAVPGPEPGTVFYPAGATLRAALGMVASPLARDLQGRASLRSLDDSPVHDLGRLRVSQTGRMEAPLLLQPGDYRLAVEGSYRDGEGKERRFTRRGPVVRVREQASLDSLQHLYGPPELAGTGVPTGVYVEGYGGQPLLELLAARPGVEAFPVRRLTPEVLAAVRVLVLPQPRRVSQLDRAARMALRQWVAGGGRLLVTHDMVGLRGLLPIVPEVCRRGTGFPRSTLWRVAAEHAAVQGVPAGLLPHAYYDHVALEAGAAGQVLAVDDADRPVLVVGEHERGRYAALGLVPGLTSGDREVPLEGGERQLVEALVSWLAEGLGTPVP